MSITDFLTFKKLSTTLLVVLVYSAIFISVLVTDNLLSVPDSSKQLGLNLTAAYNDLHIIAGSPHPYNSHRNDLVRSHILTRIQSATQRVAFAHIDDDLTSNATWVPKDTHFAVYFEGTNILVKIDGRDSSLGALLFSAHYDSVSTAPGATDNGMSVATLIQLVEYFSVRQPKRTMIFNINNGEEDGLFGAHVFLEHPWFKIPEMFINLEGAGAGGRPILLRTTSTGLARSFSHAVHPQGNSISADFFNRHAVSSQTDYSIYTDASMNGLDFAFYKPRSKYHTKDDSIPSLDGRAALWNMMETTLLTALSLEDQNGNDSDIPVYFDLFGETMVVLSLRTNFILNIALLICGPLLVAASIFLCYSSRKLYWSWKGWCRYPLAFLASMGLSVGLGVLYASLNPFIIYSSVVPVFISCMAASYLGLQVILSIFSYTRPVPQQKSIVLFQTFIFWWILLVANTAVINKFQISGLTFVTFFYVSTLVASVVSLLENFWLPATLRHRDQMPLLEDDEATEVNEETPLISTSGHIVEKEDVDEDNQILLWSLEFLLAVVFPVILMAELGILLSNSMPQTLADGNAPILVYFFISLFSFFCVFPVAAFAHKIHYFVSVAIVLILTGTILYNVFAFPFSENSALKIRFQQTIDLVSGANNVTLMGASPWLDKYIIPELPSSWSQNISCQDTAFKNIIECSWYGITPAVVPAPIDKWIFVNATLMSPGSASISISGNNSRNCKIYFDRNVTNTGVVGSSGSVQKLYPFPSGGVDRIDLWSRTWEQPFEVQIGWEGSVGLSGRAACGWAENGIPALEEVINFLPRWASVTKRAESLVEGYMGFSL